MGKEVAGAKHLFQIKLCNDQYTVYTIYTIHTNTEENRFSF